MPMPDDFNPNAPEPVERRCPECGFDPDDQKRLEAPRLSLSPRISPRLAFQRELQEYKVEMTKRQDDLAIAVVNAARRYRQAETDETPRLWRGKKLQDLANEVDEALDAFDAALEI